MHKWEVRSKAGKTYRIELETIGTGPIGAVELSGWSPRRLGRDRLLYVSYPMWTARGDRASGSDAAREGVKLRDELAIRIESDPEAAWAMDRSGLLRASDAVVISLTEEYEAVEAESGGPFITGETAISYIGYGNKMAVHRAGFVSSR